MPRRKIKKKQIKPRKTQKANPLESAVGKEVYRTWVSMLKKLVPQGRTHRLGVLVAAMLQFACCQGKKSKSLIALLSEADEDGEYGEAAADILRVVQTLFKDAGVKSKRRSARGEDYSVAEEAVQQYLAWHNYPWE